MKKTLGVNCLCFIIFFFMGGCASLKDYYTPVAQMQRKVGKKIPARVGVLIDKRFKEYVSKGFDTNHSVRPSNIFLEIGKSLDLLLREGLPQLFDKVEFSENISDFKGHQAIIIPRIVSAETWHEKKRRRDGESLDDYDYGAKIEFSLAIIDKDRRIITEHFANSTIQGRSYPFIDDYGKRMAEAETNVFENIVQQIAVSDKLDNFVKEANEVEFTFKDSKQDMEKIIIFDKIKGKDLNKTDYSTTPFKSIQRLTQDKVDNYLIPRKPFSIASKVPALVAKPNFPPPPKLVKSQFETNKMLQEREKKALLERETRILQIQKQYRKDVWGRNRVIEELKKSYDIDLISIRNEQKLKKANLSKKIVEFTKKSFFEVMGVVSLKSPTYDAETQTMYADFEASNAAFKKRISMNVSILNAEHFSKNIHKVFPFGVFTIEDNSIKLREIKVIYDKQIFAAMLTEKDFQPEKVEVVLKDQKIEFGSDTQKFFKLQNPNLDDNDRHSQMN